MTKPILLLTCWFALSANAAASDAVPIHVIEEFHIPYEYYERKTSPGKIAISELSASWPRFRGMKTIQSDLGTIFGDLIGPGSLDTLSRLLAEVPSGLADADSADTADKTAERLHQLRAGHPYWPDGLLEYIVEMPNTDISWARFVLSIIYNFHWLQQRYPDWDPEALAGFALNWADLHHLIWDGNPAESRYEPLIRLGYRPETDRNTIRRYQADPSHPIGHDINHDAAHRITLIDWFEIEPSGYENEKARIFWPTDSAAPARQVAGWIRLESGSGGCFLPFSGARNTDATTEIDAIHTYIQPGRIETDPILNQNSTEATVLPEGLFENTLNIVLDNKTQFRLSYSVNLNCDDGPALDSIDELNLEILAGAIDERLVVLSALGNDDLGWNGQLSFVAQIKRGRDQQCRLLEERSYPVSGPDWKTASTWEGLSYLPGNVEDNDANGSGEWIQSPGIRIQYTINARHQPLRALLSSDNSAGLDSVIGNVDLIPIAQLGTRPLSELDKQMSRILPRQYP